MVPSEGKECKVFSKKVVIIINGICFLRKHRHKKRCSFFVYLNR